MRVRDLKSRNGTLLDGVAVLEAFPRAGSLLRLGKTVIRFELGTETAGIFVLAAGPPQVTDSIIE